MAKPSAAPQAISGNITRYHPSIQTPRSPSRVAETSRHASHLSYSIQEILPVQEPFQCNNLSTGICGHACNCCTMTENLPSLPVQSISHSLWQSQKVSNVEGKVMDDRRNPELRLYLYTARAIAILRVQIECYVTLCHNIYKPSSI